MVGDEDGVQYNPSISLPTILHNETQDCFDAAQHSTLETKPFLYSFFHSFLQDWKTKGESESNIWPRLAGWHNVRPPGYSSPLCVWCWGFALMLWLCSGPNHISRPDNVIRLSLRWGNEDEMLVGAICLRNKLYPSCCCLFSGLCNKRQPPTNCIAALFWPGVGQCKSRK